MTALMPPFRAKEMKVLYSKVITGEHLPIPTHYSTDLKNVIKNLL